MFATLYLPNFFLQAALRHQAELAAKPVALIDDQAAKAVIIQLNKAAEEAGVHCGMTPSQGLARDLGLIVKTRIREQERLLDALLLDFGWSLAPFVEGTAPGVCTVQFTDAKHALRKVERVVAQLREAHLTAQAGIAPTPDASLLAAHLAAPVLQIEDTKDFLAPLPIETLAVT
jgi:nucleotidyltransferase/DNA polymerase involved in DNA repair